jgi:hypothetical protein
MGLHGLLQGELYLSKIHMICFAKSGLREDLYTVNRE